MPSTAGWAMCVTRLKSVSAASVWSSLEARPERSVSNGYTPGAIEIRDEVQSGIAGGVLLGGPFDQRLVVTKAGAFGNDDALVESVNWLAQGTR